MTKPNPIAKALRRPQFKQQIMPGRRPRFDFTLAEFLYEECLLDEKARKQAKSLNANS